MAKKSVFISSEHGFHKEEFDYEFFPGFALVQKQKNVESIEKSIHSKYPNYKVLEVSTKSKDDLGILLSAFNLKYGQIPVESIFQSAKVFVDDTQFDFLINYSPREAKKYIKEHSKGQLKCFRYKSIDYPLFPKTAFYDFLYIQALMQNSEVSKKLISYDAFTDVEFNPKKSINCQARTCSIYSFLLKSNKAKEYLSSFDKFIEIYSLDDEISLFD